MPKAPLMLELVADLLIDFFRRFSITKSRNLNSLILIAVWRLCSSAGKPLLQFK